MGVTCVVPPSDVHEVRTFLVSRDACRPGRDGLVSQVRRDIRKRLATRSRAVSQGELIGEVALQARLARDAPTRRHEQMVLLGEVQHEPDVETEVPAAAGAVGCSELQNRLRPASARCASYGKQLHPLPLR